VGRSVDEKQPNAPESGVDRVITLVDELSGPELLECPVCGRMGLPERIVDHDCRSVSTR